jgi:vacuolar protein 8
MTPHCTLDGRTASDDYSAFNEVWDNPEGGMHQYLHRFLTSPDATFQHIAVWTIVQLLESGGENVSSYRRQQYG